MTIIEYTRQMADSLHHGTPRRSTINAVKAYIAGGRSYEEAVVLTAYNAKYRKGPTPPEKERMLRILGPQPRPEWIGADKADNRAAAALLRLADEAIAAARMACNAPDPEQGVLYANDKLRELSRKLSKLAK